MFSSAVLYEVMKRRGREKEEGKMDRTHEIIHLVASGSIRGKIPPDTSLGTRGGGGDVINVHSERVRDSYVNRFVEK